MDSKVKVLMYAAQNQSNMKIPLWSAKQVKTNLIQQVVVSIEDYLLSSMQSTDPLILPQAQLMGEMFSSLPNVESGEGEWGRRPMTGVDFLLMILSLMWSVWSFWQSGIKTYQVWCN